MQSRNALRRSFVFLVLYEPEWTFNHPFRVTSGSPAMKAAKPLETFFAAYSAVSTQH